MRVKTHGPAIVIDLVSQQIVHFGQDIHSIDLGIASLVTVVEIALHGQFGPVPQFFSSTIPQE